MVVTHREFDVLILVPSKSQPLGEEWKKVSTETTREKADEKAEELKRLRYPSVRITEITTRVVMDTTRV